MKQLLQDAEIVPALIALFDSAEHSIIILQYQFRAPFRPRAQMRAVLDALLRAAGRGVQVTILLNNPNRPKRPGPQHGAIRTWLSHPAIKILHYAGDQILHTKLAIADHARILLGSHNLSQQSFSSSRNISILTDDPAAAAAAARTALALIKAAHNGTS
jgi:phosphatidylserine/phosphatidylglycerophosphate/cardiolipin synthase-like enzyme